MASLGLIESELRSLPKELQAPLLRIFRAIIKDVRFGHPVGEQPDPSENFGGGFFHATTPSTPGDLFTIPHGFGRTPYLLVPVLPLDVEGAAIVPLQIAQVADDKRVYLTSTIADAPVTVFLEG